MVGESLKENVSVQLLPDSELCIAVPLNEREPLSTFCLKPNATNINDPKVDIMGAPMVPGVQYHLLPGLNFTIFAWSVATIDFCGSSTMIRNIFRNPSKSITRPLIEYHCLLHQCRAEADKKLDVGPIVLVCGSANSDKGYVARSLCSYAARSGWKPLLVDLDCSVSQMIGFPGTIGASIFEYPMVVDEIISQTQLSISFFTGSLECQTIGETVSSVNACYASYTTLLLDAVKQRLESHIGTFYASSGAIIVLPELLGNSGVDFIVELTDKYGISKILCCADDHLFHKLYSRFCDVPASQVHTKVDKLSPSFFSSFTPSVETLLPKLLKEYFFGKGMTNIYPANWTQPLDKIEVFFLKDENNKAILTVIEREGLQGISGCMSALFYYNHSQNLFAATPFTFAKIDSVDAAGIHLLTTTHAPPQERICAIVGTVRWISS